MEAKYKTGIERFYDRFPNYHITEREEDYIGVGAICDSNLIERIKNKYYNGGKK
jgi:hypothetical protein